jgi:hypothetical protein
MGASWTEWSTWGADPQRTNANLNEPVLTPATVSGLKLACTLPVAGQVCVNLRACARRIR